MVALFRILRQCFLLRLYNCIQKGSLTCHRKENAFISKESRNWKKATERFVQHANSDCHREALEREFKLKSEVKEIGESLSEQHNLRSKGKK